MGDIIGLPAASSAATLRRVSARLAEGSRSLHAQGDDLLDQAAALGALRAALREQVVLTDEIASLAGAIEVAVADGDMAALNTLQARLLAMMAAEIARTEAELQFSDAAD